MVRILFYHVKITTFVFQNSSVTIFNLQKIFTGSQRGYIQQQKTWLYTNLLWYKMTMCLLLSFGSKTEFLLPFSFHGGGVN